MPKHPYSVVADSKGKQSDKVERQILLSRIIILRNLMLKVVRLTEPRCTLGLQPILRLSRLSEGCQSFAYTACFSCLLAFSSCRQLRAVLLIPFPTESVSLLDGRWQRMTKFSREFNALLPLYGGFEGSKAFNSLENWALCCRLSACQMVASIVFACLKVVKSVLSSGNRSGVFLCINRVVRAND